MGPGKSNSVLSHPTQPGLAGREEMGRGKSDGKKALGIGQRVFTGLEVEERIAKQECLSTPHLLPDHHHPILSVNYLMTISESFQKGCVGVKIPAGSVWNCLEAEDGLGRCFSSTNGHFHRLGSLEAQMQVSRAWAGRDLHFQPMPGNFRLLVGGPHSSNKEHDNLFGSSRA